MIEKIKKIISDYIAKQNSHRLKMEKKFHTTSFILKHIDNTMCITCNGVIVHKFQEFDSLSEMNNKLNYFKSLIN